MVTYDTGSDGSFCDKLAVEELGHNNEKLKYNMTTVTSTTSIEGWKGNLYAQQPSNKWVKIPVTSVEVEKGGLLGEHTLAPVKIPLEVQAIAPWASRHGWSRFNLIIGAEKLSLHPEEILWESSTGDSRVLKSKLTGKPLLAGLWEGREESVNYSSESEEEDRQGRPPPLVKQEGTRQEQDSMWQACLRALASPGKRIKSYWSNRPKLPDLLKWTTRVTNRPTRARDSTNSDIETNPGPQWTKYLPCLIFMGLLRTSVPRPVDNTKIRERRLVRVKRTLFTNINNFFFQGPMELSLVKYSSEAVTTNNYHGEYRDVSIGSVGTLNQEGHNPSMTENLLTRGNECQLYAGPMCVMANKIGAGRLTPKEIQDSTGPGGDYAGTGTALGTFNDGNGSTGMFHRDWAPVEEDPVKYLEFDEEMNSWEEELEEKSSDLAIKPCKKSVNFANQVKKVHKFLSKYSSLLKQFVGRALSPQGFLPAYNSDDDWARRAIYKIGDPLWTHAGPNQTLGEFSLKSVQDTTYDSLTRACEWRGANLVEIDGAEQHEDVRKLCDESNLNCGMLLLKAPIQGRTLRWSSGRPALMEVPDAFRKKYFPADNPAKQAQWNKDPYIALAFSKDKKQEYFMGYGGKNDTRFPNPEEVRSLCVFPEEAPQSMAVSTVLQFHDDVMGKTLNDLEDYKRKYTNIQSSIEKYNFLDGEPESILDQKERIDIDEPDRRKRREVDEQSKCTEADIELVNGDDYITEILKKLRISPTQLHQLVDQTKVYFSKSSRDFNNDYQAEIRNKEAQAGKSLTKIKRLIPEFLQICERWYKVVDELFMKIPNSLNNIGLSTNHEVLFGDVFELETLITTSVTLFLSFLLNLVLICYMTRAKKNPVDIPHEEAEVVPLQQFPAQNEVRRQWPEPALPFPNSRTSTRELARRWRR